MGAGRRGGAPYMETVRLGDCAVRIFLEGGILSEDEIPSKEALFSFFEFFDGRFVGFLDQRL